MPVRSQRITLRDIKSATETVYECRDLWADPPAWQAHLMRRATALTGSRIGLYFEMANDAGKAVNKILAAQDTGWECESERLTVVEGLANRPLRYSALWASFGDMLGARGRATGGMTVSQKRLIATSDWWSSEMYDRHVRPTRLGEALVSAVWMPHTASWSAWSLVTDRGDPLPSQRSERLVRMLHNQIAPLTGTQLSTWRDRTVAPLSSTRRRVLEALLDGMAEPDIARDTYRSRSAVHEHVTALYRHFGVTSRGELAAFFLRRQPTAANSREVGPPKLVDWLGRPWVDAPEE